MTALHASAWETVAASALVQSVSCFSRHRPPHRRTADGSENYFLYRKIIPRLKNWRSTRRPRSCKPISGWPQLGGSMVGTRAARGGLYPPFAHRSAPVMKYAVPWTCMGPALARGECRRRARKGQLLTYIRPDDDDDDADGDLEHVGLELGEVRLRRGLIAQRLEDGFGLLLRETGCRKFSKRGGGGAHR